MKIVLPFLIQEIELELSYFRSHIEEIALYECNI